jgi:cell division protein FtsX
VILLPHMATTAPLVGYDASGKVVARSPARGRCSVKLYLQDPRTADLAAAIAGARGTAGVDRVRYVSKAVALGRMKKRYPDLTKDLAFNPLPASIDVTPTRADEVAQLARRLTAERLPGVETVKYGCVRR